MRSSTVRHARQTNVNVVVSPRGFGPFERPGGYTEARCLDDLARVLNHLAVLEYAAFGYSMSGVMAARLAVSNRGCGP